MKSSATAPGPRAPVWKPTKLRVAPCSGSPPVMSLWTKFSRVPNCWRLFCSPSSISSHRNRDVGNPYSRSSTTPGSACTESIRQPPLNTRSRAGISTAVKVSYG